MYFKDLVLQAPLQIFAILSTALLINSSLSTQNEVQKGHSQLF